MNEYEKPYKITRERMQNTDRTFVMLLIFPDGASDLVLYRRTIMEERD
uniref:Uncharacterized protein n=1 Tax=Rhizophora mucronata TaxID=61149 RepID=A0A2P2NB45_RHIMU